MGLERRGLLNGDRQRRGAYVRDLVAVELDNLERRGHVKAMAATSAVAPTPVIWE